MFGDIARDAIHLLRMHEFEEVTFLFNGKRIVVRPELTADLLARIYFPEWYDLKHPANV